VIRLGDVIEVLGTRYRIVRVAGNLTVDPNTGYLIGQPGAIRSARLVVAPLNNTGQLLRPTTSNIGEPITAQWLTQAVAASDGNRPYWTDPAPYKIFRQPTPTSAAPFQLPEAVAIDLEASGIVGEVPFHFVDANGSLTLFETPVNTPVYIMFSPEGSIERVQYNRAENNGLGSVVLNTRLDTPTANVSLLVGRRENIPASTTLDLTSGTEAEREEAKSQLNWLNLESRWVTIGAQTGSVVTTENAFVSPGTLTYIDYNGDGIDGLDRRRTQILAAQEFAREMRRLGGR
jgi:hypothetical protein